MTPEELQIIEYAKANGKNKTQALIALQKYRDEQAGKKPSFLQDAGQDVATGVQRAGQSIGEAYQGVKTELQNQDTSTLGGKIKQTLGIAGQIGKGVAGAVGNVIGGAAAAVLPQKVEDVGTAGAQYAAQEVTSSEPWQFLEQNFQKLPPEAQKVLGDLYNIGEGVAAVTGAGALKTGAVRGAQATGQAAAQVGKTAARVGGDVVDAGVIGTKAVGKGVLSLPQKVVETIPRKWRAEISDIDPQVETILKRGDVTPDEINTFFQKAQNARKDASKATPFELVGERAEKAFTDIQSRLTKASEGKERILANMGSETMEGLPDIRTTLGDEVTSRFGMQFTDDGLVQATGRQAKLDAPSQKLITEYNDRLLQLGDTPSVREVDDFVDWAQSQLYKQSKEVSKLAAADDKVVGLLKQKTGEINSALKQRVGGGYAEANARVQDLLDMQEELSRGLGADARKGAGFVKRYFSPASTVTRETFERIKKETGIDLGKDAVLAKFAMENVGDVRQRSLLKSLDIAVQEAAEIDLTKPMSIVRFLRERADLDGQELANEILKITKTGEIKQ